MRSNPLLPLPPTPPHTRVRKRDVNHATQAEAEAHVEGHTKTHPDTHAEAHTEAEAPPLTQGETHGVPSPSLPPTGREVQAHVFLVKNTPFY